MNGRCCNVYWVDLLTEDPIDCTIEITFLRYCYKIRLLNELLYFWGK